MQLESNRRSELGQYLRLCRERITPGDVGLATGPRRRSPGLRRGEVAVLAGVSTSWYTFLEQGRDILPSRTVLDSISQVLRLTEDERHYVHSLAYGSDAGPALNPSHDPTVLIRQIMDLWESSPYPAYACDQYCDLVAWNRAASEWYGDWGRLPVEDRNILHWLLTAAEARERLVDWKDVTRDVVARWRLARSRQAGDETFERITRRLMACSPDFASWWLDHEVLEHRTARRRFRHAVLGVQDLRVVPLLSPELGRCGIVLHLPFAP